MAEQNKTQMGDGADNYGQAAGQMAKAAKQLGQEAAKQAAAKGVEATANAATAAVQASVEGGKAAAEIAAGTAAGGLGVRFFRQLGLCVTHCLKF